MISENHGTCPLSLAAAFDSTFKALPSPQYINPIVALNSALVIVKPFDYS